MLEEMVKAVVNKVIAQDYPFLKSSAALYAIVTKATQLGETFDPCCPPSTRLGQDKWDERPPHQSPGQSAPISHATETTRRIQIPDSVLGPPDSAAICAPGRPPVSLDIASQKKAPGTPRLYLQAKELLLYEYMRYYIYSY